VPRTHPEEPEVYSITGARSALSDDLDRRMGRYLLSMGIRTACVILVLVVDGPLRWVFAAGAIVLPYVAVIFANQGRRHATPTVPVGDLRRPPRQVSAGPASPRPADSVPGWAGTPTPPGPTRQAGPEGQAGQAGTAGDAGPPPAPREPTGTPSGSASRS
jgi:hypothetical protein